ncbi:MAG: VWA domain-containing protein [Acidobacteriota bacterium]
MSTFTWMRKAGLVVLLGAVSIPWLTALGQDPRPQDPEFRIDVNLVTIRFSVKDSQRRFVNNLSQEDFRVYEGSLPQDILFFEPPKNTSAHKTGLRLAFLIDVSGSTFATRAEQILAARTFFDNLQEFTRVGVFGFTDKLIDFQDFTTNRELAVKGLGDARRHLGRTAIYQTLNTLMARMQTAGAASDRKVVIVISDAIDENHQLSAQSIALARRDSVSIYTILVPSAAQLYIRPEFKQGSSDNPSQEALRRERQRFSFERLSRQTGGLHFSGFGAILDFDQTLAQITDSVFGNLYSIAYSSQDRSPPKEERDIRVSIVPSGLQASALFSSLPERFNAKKKLIAALFGDEADFGELQIDLDYREIGATIDLLRTTGGGKSGQSFRLKINPLTLSGDRHGLRTQLGIVGLLLDREGNEVVRLREVLRINMSARELLQGNGIIYNNKIMAPEGVYNFRLAILEISTWKMTAFETVVTIG